MKAICKACGKENYWRATRGSKLSQHRCACGGELAGVYGRPSKHKGERYGVCECCGRRRLKARLATLPCDVVLFGGTFCRAGSVVCSEHQTTDFTPIWRFVSEGVNA